MWRFINGNERGRQIFFFKFVAPSKPLFSGVWVDDINKNKNERLLDHMRGYLIHGSYVRLSYRIVYQR